MVVFGMFAAGHMIIAQQVGSGFGLPVSLSATPTRSSPVPGSLDSPGSRNWYPPSALRWPPVLRVGPIVVGMCPTGTGADQEVGGR